MPKFAKPFRTDDMRKILLTAMLLLCAVVLRAQGVVSWHLLTDDGKAVPVRNVVCLMLVDYEILDQSDTKRFNVVMADGNVLKYIKSVNFAEREEDDEPLAVSSAIEAACSLSFSMLPRDTKVQVFSADGKLLRQAEAQKVDISGLPSGTYVIKIGKTTVKMLKK